jgi:glycolate oxidase subunit GlcD
MDWTAEILAELRALLGDDGVLDSEAARFTYEADAILFERALPDVVALPRSTDEVAALVRWAHAHGVPVTPRGAGTGLAGGSTPHLGGIVLSVNRMDQVLRVDAERMFAWVQPGLVNLELSRQTAPLGLGYAPDPASQQVSTIGGNVAANSGGPHCLKYGVTFNHTLGAVVVLHDGMVVELGGEAPDAPDLDLASIVTGSEGTLGILTEICVRLVPLPEAVETLLFDFADVADACHAVSAVIAAGMVPAAMEIMDTPTLEVVEAWLHLGLPLDAGGVLLLEVDGAAVSLPAQVERITAIAGEHRARSTRRARDAAERAALWRGRKSAFGAYGRTGRGFYIMDGVVPRTRLAEALAAVYALARERGLRAGNVFHAGDGNLHPHILFDPDDPRSQQAALEVSQEILRTCIRMGGTISGEHGIGIEKVPLMSELYAPEDLALMERLRRAFDPDRLLNPCKVLPGGAGCGESHAHGPGAAGRAPAQLGGRDPRSDMEGPWM